MNIAGLTGNLTKKPSLKLVGKDQTPKCELRIASQELGTGKIDGAGKPIPGYLDVECWGKSAENTATYMDSGSFVILSGAIKYEEYEVEVDGAKQKRRRVFIKASRVDFGPKAVSGDGAPAGDGNPDGDIPF